MKILSLLFCILFSGFVSLEKLNVQVLYESLCPDSYNFVAQFAEHQRELSNYMNVEFVPFGKSSFNGEIFECQHGPKECLGNRIQSCVLDLVDNQDDQAKYVYCFMWTYRNGPFNAIEQCSTDLGIEWNKVNACIKSLKGTELQLKAEEATEKFQPRFIPTIVYNGKFNQTLQDKSLSNFKDVVCDFIREEHPDVCPQPQVLNL